MYNLKNLTNEILFLGTTYAQTRNVLVCTVVTSSTALSVHVAKLHATSLQELDLLIVLCCTYLFLSTSFFLPLTRIWQGKIIIIIMKRCLMQFPIITQ
jgi:hypothetical protein